MERFAGRFALLRLLGQGGMGTVHLALDLSTGTECALKRLHPKVVADPTSGLRTEFELLARVRHPAVVGVRELGFAPDGTAYYTMEYVPGVSADRGLRRGDWRALCFAAAEVAHGLEALHDAGVLHGDLKPSNLLVVPGEDADALPAGVRILDFGLAALLDREREGHRGTPGYAAPEVVRGDAPTIASDLFGLGATLYALAAGRVSFAPSTRSSSSSGRKPGAPPSAVALDDAGTPPALARLVLRLMAPSPAERPRDAREVRAELERIEPAARRSLARRLRTERVVGRERELARIDRWLEATRAAGSVLLVEGDPGVGKSALLGELAVRASLAGRRVMRFSCAEFPAPGALAHSLWRRLAAESGADEDVTGPVLATFAGGPLTESDLARLADAAVDWARQLAGSSAAPLVILDDRERLDPLSRALLRRAAFHPAGDAVRWVWSGRRTQDDLDDQLIVEAGVAWRLELGPLDEDAGTTLAAARLHAPAPRELLSFLQARTGGHPGMMIELMRIAAESGALAETDEGPHVNPEALATLATPAAFEASLVARWQAQAEDARRAALALAVRARPAHASELRAPGGPVLDSGLHGLQLAGLSTRDADGRFALAPPALGPAIVATLAVDARRAWHREALAEPDLSPAERFAHLREAGDSLEALAEAERALAAGSGVEIARAAAELAESSVPGRAAAWLERAGEMLIEVGHHAEAVPFLERSLEREPGAPERFRRMRRLSVVYLRVGRLAELEPLLARALAEGPDARERSLLECNESARLQAHGRGAEALDLAHRAVASAHEARDDEALGYATLSVGVVVMTMGDRTLAEHHAIRAEEAFARAGITMGRTRALGLRASIAGVGGHLPEAEKRFRQALDVAEGAGLRVVSEELRSNLAVLLTNAGRWSEAAEMFERSLRSSIEDGRAPIVASLLGNLALLDALSGRTTRATRRARAALRLTREHAPRHVPFACRVLATGYRVAGRTREAERAATRALARATRAGIPWEADWSRVEFAKACAQANRWKEAGEVAAHALAQERMGDPIASIVLASISGRAALREREFGVADARLARATTELSERTTPYAAAHVTQLLAERALVQGRWEDGLDNARTALQALDALPAVADRAQAALEFAKLSFAAPAGVDAPVAEWLEEAAGAFERLGDHRGRERALALTVEWLHRTRLPASTVAHERDLLKSVSHLLDSLSDVQALAKRSMQMAVEHLDAERGVLLLQDAKTGKYTPMTEHGAIDAATRDQAASYSHRVVERVHRSGGSLLITDAPTNPDLLSESMVDLGLRSILCVPFFRDGKVVGAVYVDDSRRADAFTPDDRGLLEGFAHLMSVAIERSLGHQEVVRANERLVGENLELRREARARFQPHNFIGTSTAMQRVLAVVERAAQTNATVLITGENGTGKELVARTLHHSGRRHEAPFVAVNCGAIPEGLLESELFGILDDVATGVRRRDGRFVQANGGTLFLDEIGEMPPKQQVALLSVLANREVTPVGGGKPIPVDVRVIAATNCDLRRSVEDGSFRQDLYFRLNVIPIEMPALRARKSDIPQMAQYFIAQIAKQQERAVPQPSPEFIAALMQSDWPGNVRELQAYIERIMAMTPGDTLLPRPLPGDLEEQRTRVRITHGRSLADVMGDIERRLVQEALQRAEGNQSQAARDLGLTEQSLRYRLRKYTLEDARRNRRTRRKQR